MTPLHAIPGRTSAACRRCASASAGRSARARRPWSRCSARRCATATTWSSSPTTSTPRKTSACSPSPARSRPSGSWASRPAAARTPRSARTRRSTSRRSTACWRSFPNADIVFVESGGDNLAATFSPELCDLTIYVIDVAAGEKIPRKGGPGITKSDLFVINKTDLAPHVGADLEVMRADTLRMRGERAVRDDQPEDARRAGRGDRLHRAARPASGYRSSFVNLVPSKLTLAIRPTPESTKLMIGC